MGIGGAILGGAALSTVGGLIGGSQQNSAISSAANTQAAANQAAQQTQMDMYNQTADRLNPYTMAGYQAIADLQPNNPMYSATGFPSTTMPLPATAGKPLAYDEWVKQYGGDVNLPSTSVPNDYTWWVGGVGPQQYSPFTTDQQGVSPAANNIISQFSFGQPPTEPLDYAKWVVNNNLTQNATGRVNPQTYTEYVNMFSDRDNALKGAYDAYVQGFGGQGGATGGQATPSQFTPNPITTPTPADLEGLNLPTLEGVAEIYKTLPGYQERLAEGIRAQDMSASARGTLGGGGYQKALTRYGQDYASNEFNNAYNRLYQQALAEYTAGVDKYNAGWDTYNAKTSNAQFLANLGQNSAAQTGNIGANTASNIGNLQSNTGAALASAQAGQVNPLVSGLTGLGNTALTYGMYDTMGLFK
jgi:hypothetical protein